MMEIMMLNYMSSQVYPVMVEIPLAGFHGMFPKAEFSKTFELSLHFSIILLLVSGNYAYINPDITDRFGDKTARYMTNEIRESGENTKLSS